ncbi:hypothetical protein [Companilactobacillus mishanensis]|uniref:Surface layer protein A domain-containing protein n=1 Tax=Companilactobacillus mishanensis TaxID=2486008 RepID=A0A5P0ZK97_9LACO|nr:hypothetical protein [Companilactobacillus mishanensis]MQS53415.1 hypothetical protein [Companilactobacillus mishanensis]
MKRIKYAGLTTATLLAVAPVVFQTTTVDAATNVTTKAAINPGMLNPLQSVADFWNNFSNKYLLKYIPIDDGKVQKEVPNLTGMTYDGTTNQSSMDSLDDMMHKQFNHAVSFDQFMNTNLLDPVASKEAMQVLGSPNKSSLNYLYKITPADSETESDFRYKYDDVLNKGNGAQLTFGLQVIYKGKDGNPKNGKEIARTSITVTNNRAIVAPATELHVNFDSPLNVEVGSKTVDAKLSNTVNASVTNQDGTMMPFSAVPGEIYQTEDGARTRTGNIVTSSTFNNKGDKFYQPVMISFKNADVDVNAIYNKMVNDKSNLITFNGNTATSTNVDTTNKTITYIRVVTVGEEPTTIDRPDEVNDGWSINNLHGVVTVRDEAGPLYNDDNKITSRSIDAHTGWQTDKYRINNESGEIQYRVSTHEWVNSDMVDFVQTEANEATSETAMTNITDLQGHHVISLSGADKDKVYPLYNTNGKKLTRNLGQGSAWQTDKQATDSEGNTVYRVSTDEWVRLEAGVSFK